jgi:hypothetical protein
MDLITAERFVGIVAHRDCPAESGTRCTNLGVTVALLILSPRSEVPCERVLIHRYCEATDHQLAAIGKPLKVGGQVLALHPHMPGIQSSVRQIRERFAVTDPAPALSLVHVE